MKIYQAEAVTQHRFLLAEGPYYQPETETLHWVDIKTGTLYGMRAGGGTSQVQTGQYLGAAVPTKKGRTLLAMATGIYLLDGTIRLLCRPPELTANLRLNDGKCDAAGRFWFGTIALLPESGEKGSLFCLEPDGSCRRVLVGPRVSNGMAWTEDAKTFYYIDTPTLGVDAFDFDLQTGSATNRRQVFRTQTGMPDGMAIDREGMLWVALWGGGQVVRVNPTDGSIVGQIPLPAKNVTSCCFGGRALDTLYITTSGEGFDDAGAGRIYAAKPGVPGNPVSLFDDSML